MWQWETKKDDNNTVPYHTPYTTILLYSLLPRLFPSPSLRTIHHLLFFFFVTYSIKLWNSSNRPSNNWNVWGFLCIYLTQTQIITVQTHCEFPHSHSVEIRGTREREKLQQNPSRKRERRNCRNRER